jgi:glycosyltransferase involved in cell wall biosynthesis
MRTLHVAALPFPSPQGTQALVHTMLDALAAAGREVELITYAHGAGPFTGGFALTRARSLVAGRSLRSGPSLEKLALDVGLAATLRERERVFAPDFVVAHHIEAALAALAVCRAPVVYVAHTSLETELPTYAESWPSSHRALAAAGAALERAVCRRAACVLAVSPLLARMLGAAAAVEVSPLVLPWPLPPPIDAAERVQARRSFGLRAALVLLYAGNLDAYQGLDVLSLGLAQLRAQRDFTWLVATAAPHDSPAARALLARVGSEHVRFAPLASEAHRRLVHAAADVVLVPRASAGGVPIKLLDALARGVPVVAARRACAGLALEPVCDLVPDDDAGAFTEVLRVIRPRPEQAARSREAIAHGHQGAAFVSSFERALC